MRMRVDEPGSEQRVRPVQPLLGLKPLVDFGLRSHADDALAAHRHCAVLDNTPLWSHRQDIARAPDHVGGLCDKRDRGQKKATEKTHRRALGIDLSEEMFRSYRADSPARVRCLRRTPTGSSG